MQVDKVSSPRTKPFWNNITEKKLRELKQWDIVTDGACMTIFDHSLKFHFFNKFSRLPIELRAFQLEAQMLKEQPVKPSSRKYFQVAY